MEQATLTEYYSAKKRPIEGTNPAKRRKLVGTEAVVSSEARSKRESTQIIGQRSKTFAPKSTRVLRTRKNKTKEVTKATENSNLDSFLSLGNKEVSEKSEMVVSEVTSIKDDHETEIVVSKAIPYSTRKRKQQPKLDLNRREEQCSDKNTNEIAVYKAYRSRTTRKPKAKEISKDTAEVQNLQKPELTKHIEDIKKHSTEENKNDGTSTSNQVKTTSKECKSRRPQKLKSKGLSKDTNESQKLEEDRLVQHSNINKNSTEEAKDEDRLTSNKAQISKECKSRSTQKPESKGLSKDTNESQKLEREPVKDIDINKSSTTEAKDEGRSTASVVPSKYQAKPKQSIMVPEKSPVRTANSSSGLKINPWIADQANKVLFSRGKPALLLSHQKNAGICQKSGSLNEFKKPVAEKNGLSKTKAQEGLEKARELIKKMRSLESDSLKSKDITCSTVDTSVRLHKLAKRSSTDGAKEKSDSSAKKAPAYERFHSLAQPTPPSSTVTVSLPLPYKYKVLGEMFTCCDTVLNLLGQRKEACIFDKLKESVQQMCRKRFERSHLAQMVFLYPTCYDLQQVRNSSKSSSYQLIIQFGPGKNSTESRMTVSTTELLTRKKTFHEKLLTVTKKQHQSFLQSLETPLSIDDDKIIRWHPQFQLDNVLDIEKKALPEPPVIKTFTSAQDVLDKGRGFLAPKVEKALKNAAVKSKEKTKIEITYDSQPKVEVSNSKTTGNNVKASNALKGVSQDLLNKIRQKEARKLEEKLMRDPVLDKKMVMQQRLPELCRILKTYFTTEKKAAIPFEDATVKLSESSKSLLSPGQVEEHLNLLSEIAPEWMSVLMVRKCPYVKINRKMDINNVIQKVAQMELK